jgi:hypothetical protein
MSANEVELTRSPARWTGTHVVLGMLLFGVTMVAALWLYWEMYTRPFRPLQNAIHAEFPDSSPRVIGGKPKSHRADSPSTLRIICRVYFDPETDTAQAEDMAARLAALAGQHHDVTRYELLEIHLEQRVPEAASRHWSVSRPVDEWATRAKG